MSPRWPRLRAQLDVLNALDAEDHDIDYFYASRLPGEPEEGIEDLDFKRFEPRQLRATVTNYYCNIHNKKNKIKR